jgi:DNA-binding GntR family transcriptional regulator
MNAFAEAWSVRTNTMNNGRSGGGGVYKRVYERLRADIIGQQFAPGTRLMINDLATRYEASITPVREALNRLTEEMLIEFEPGRGYFCKTPNLKELEDLYRLLEILLLFAASETISRGTADGIAELCRELTVKGLNADSLEAACAAFWEQTNNRVIAHVGNNVLARTHAMRQIDFESPDRATLIEKAVGEFCIAIRHREGERAGQIIRREIRAKLDRLPSLLTDMVSRPYLRGRDPSALT